MGMNKTETESYEKLKELIEMYDKVLKEAVRINKGLAEENELLKACVVDQEKKIRSYHELCEKYEKLAVEQNMLLNAAKERIEEMEGVLNETFREILQEE